MNAYELAGRLLEKKLYLIQEGVNSSYLEDAANMLRQQADRIAELENKLDGCTCQGGHSEAYLKAKGRLK